MSQISAAEYQQRTALLYQQMAVMRQQMTQQRQQQYQQPSQQYQPQQPQGSQVNPFASTPDFIMPGADFWGGVDGDPFALTAQEQRLTSNLSSSAFSGTRGGLGMDNFNQYTNADDVFGNGFMDAMGQYSTSPYASNYKSSSELFIEGMNSSKEGADFMRDVHLLTASAPNGKPHDVLGTDSNGQPHKENTDLSPKKMKEIMFKAYAEKMAEKAIANGQGMPA